MTLLSKLTRPALALTLGASLALSPIATPQAKAENEAAFAAAVIGLMIAAGAIGSGSSANAGSRGSGNSGYDQWPGRGHGNYRNAKALPGECVVQINHGRDRGAYFDKRCLNHSMDRPQRLPQSCETSLRYRNGGWRPVYEAGCLYRKGYVIEAQNRHRH